MIAKKQKQLVLLDSSPHSSIDDIKSGIYQESRNITTTDHALIKQHKKTESMFDLLNNPKKHIPEVMFQTNCES